MLWGAALTLGAGTLATLKSGRWFGIGMLSLGTGLAAAGAVAGALVAELLMRHRGAFSPRGREPSGRRSENEDTDALVQCELQQLLEIAINRPRLLLTDHWQGMIHHVAHRLGVSNGNSVPWQLLFVYRQLEAVVDSLTYDELYEMFGGNPTPAAITKEEARLLPSEEYAEETKEKKQSDTISCPICLQDYQKGERLAVLPLCHHSYHTRCITRWLRSRGDCPICRTHVKDNPRQAVHVH